MNSADELIELFQNAEGNALNQDIQLGYDLDFSDANLTFPLGVLTDGTCVVYTGEFKGNGYSVKGLKMNNTNNVTYQNAGLFCNLENTVISSLVIDSSCSFIGDMAGALAVSVTGSLKATNATNHADVNGKTNVGGLIASMTESKLNSVVLLENCTNNGKVTGDEWNVGAFFGIMDNSQGVTLTISNSTNSGKVTGKYCIGGFVGRVFRNPNMVMTILSSTNNATITASENRLGGFVGYIENSNNMILSILNY